MAVTMIIKKCAFYKYLGSISVSKAAIPALSLRPRKCRTGQRTRFELKVRLQHPNKVVKSLDSSIVSDLGPMGRGESNTCGNRAVSWQV